MKFSIITVCFNASATIADTLRSVAAQSWSDFEHLVIDGKSSDDTVPTVERLAYPKLRLVSEPDQGIYDAMNKGAALATGDALCFLNADDFFARSDALRLVANAFSEAGADCVSGQTLVVDRDDPSITRRLYGSAWFRPWMLRFGHMPSHPAFFIKRSVFDAIGPFDTSYRIAGDFDHMVRLLLRQRASIARLKRTLTVFRDGGASGRKVKLNAEVHRSLRANGIWSNPMFPWLRYPLKALQLIARPADYGALDLLQHSESWGVVKTWRR